MPAPAECLVPDVAADARKLAAENGAAVLTAALVVRLRTDGRAELAAAIASLCAGAEGAGERAGDDLLDPNPPHPHIPGGEEPIIDPGPPSPH